MTLLKIFIKFYWQLKGTEEVEDGAFGKYGWN